MGEINSDDMLLLFDVGWIKFENDWNGVEWHCWFCIIMLFIAMWLWWCDEENEEDDEENDVDSDVDESGDGVFMLKCKGICISVGIGATCVEYEAKMCWLVGIVSVAFGKNSWLELNWRFCCCCCWNPLVFNAACPGILGFGLPPYTAESMYASICGSPYGQVNAIRWRLSFMRLFWNQTYI